MENMKIGIHDTKGFFSDRWITYCREKGLDFKIVDCYSSDIVRQLDDCEALMWHYNHKSARASKFAKQLLFSLESSGKFVFPDFNTAWHFDDKVAQKYLLESIGAPLAKSYVFYDKQNALHWAANTVYPKVFKLRNGAGSDNVRLVRSETEAGRLIRRSFGRGFRQYDAIGNLKERYRKYRLGKTSFWELIKGILRIFRKTDYARVTGRERGYAYFQEFIPGNDSDIRIIVIGNKAFAIKRMVRKNDFRASGSGFILYEKKHFDDAVVKLAFDISDKLKCQCMAYDFVFLDGSPLIVEISYGFSMTGYDPCPGFWDSNLNWHEGKFNPYGWMIEDLIDQYGKRKLVKEL
jgi:glutathione synthase/RimK-type ligase-like ATP-grasp enzyme